MKLFVKIFDNEGNVVAVPVTSDDIVAPGSLKLAETYEQYMARTKETRARNYASRTHNRFVGSVLLHGRS